MAPPVPTTGPAWSGLGKWDAWPENITYCVLGIALGASAVRDGCPAVRSRLGQEESTTL